MSFKLGISKPVQILRTKGDTLNLRSLINIMRSFSSKTELSLFETLECKIPEERERIMKFRKENGNVKIADVIVNHLFMGMRGLLAMYCETSLVDPMRGILFRGLTVDECMELLPRAKGGCVPLPEAMFWLLVTGDVPSKNQVKEISCEWAHRCELPNFIYRVLKQMPKNVHPMSQLASIMSAMSVESEFAKAFNKGVKKDQYWKFIYEDAMNLIGRLPLVASVIYQNVYKGGKGCREIDLKSDFSMNFVRLLGHGDNKELAEMMRLYMSTHCDHDVGNVSAHTIHLVGSALSDPYLSYGAGIAGLAGPLHGRANQEVVKWLFQMKKEIGPKPDDKKIIGFVNKTLKSGKVIPGFGHAVLRTPDPRFLAQLEFAQRLMPDDENCVLVRRLSKIVPKILKKTGKVANPYPNVDAHSGVLLQYYGLKEVDFYTIFFGISRGIGALAQLIWTRALGYPIERPQAISLAQLVKLVKTVKKKGKKAVH